MKGSTNRTKGRIAILEWICGGGLTRQELQSANSLLAEGQAMLDCAIREALAAGYEIAVALHASLQTAARASGQAVQVQRIQDGQEERILEHWLHLARSSDLALVIAPEIDGGLVSTCAALRHAGVALHNCGPELLRVCSDKEVAAEWLQSAGLLHPPTRRLGQVSTRWLADAQHRFGNQHWVLKPSDGAGCEGLELLEHRRLLALLGDCEACSEQQLIQPWVAGQAFSQSAVVDDRGTWHWQPLMTQEFERLPKAISSAGLKTSGESGETLAYQGGCIADFQATPAELIVLRQQLSRLPWSEQALGWISFDLVQEAKSGSWYVIEANARCTTSMCFLQQIRSLDLFPHAGAAQNA